MEVYQSFSPSVFQPSPAGSSSTASVSPSPGLGPGSGCGSGAGAGPSNAGQKRAKTGCITCRLRKKRCDEAKPTCATCERLGIECLGYGAKRPNWMKVDENKRSAREEIKRKIIAQTKRKSVGGESLESSTSPGQNQSPDHGELKSTGVACKRSRLEDGFERRSQPFSGQRWTWLEERSGGVFNEATLPHHMAHVRSSDSDVTGVYGHDHVPSQFSAHPHSSHPETFWRTLFTDGNKEMNPGKSRLFDFGHATTPFNTPVPLTSFSPAEYSQPWNPTSHNPFMSSFSPNQVLPAMSSMTSPPSHTDTYPETHFVTLYSPLQLDTESSASAYTGYLHHYLTVVLPLQYRLGSKALSDFLGSLALTRDDVMTAAASLAALHLSSQRTAAISYVSNALDLPGNPDPTLASSDDSDALIATTTHQQSVQKLGNGSSLDLASEEVIVSTVFAASYHLFSGGISKGWEHLVELNQRCLGIALGSSPEVMGGPTLYTSPSPWKRFRPLIGVMIWMDIIGSVTRNKGSRLLSTYRALFSPSSTSSVGHAMRGLAMDRVMGCDNLTLLAYAEITHLAEWRELAESAGCLSIKELVQRADTIEKRLAERSWGFGISGQAGAFFEGQAESEKDEYSTEPHDSNTITVMREIFFAGAKVYLALVVNGPYPKVPEIASAVQQTITSLAHLDTATCNSHINRALVLPITLTGCLADTPAQQSFFRSRYQNLGPEAASFGNSSQALMLMEEVWRQRATAPLGTKVCWRKVMRDLGWEEGIFLI